MYVVGNCQKGLVGEVEHTTEQAVPRSIQGHDQRYLLCKYFVYKYNNFNFQAKIIKISMVFFYIF